MNVDLSNDLGALLYFLGSFLGFRQLCEAVKLTRKWLLVAISLALATFVLPILITYLRSSGWEGYFEGGKCICGHSSFLIVDKEAVYDFSLGHKDKKLLFTLRKTSEGFEAVRKDGSIKRVYRVQDGEVYSRRVGTTNWIGPEPRVYNIWRVWISEWL